LSDSTSPYPPPVEPDRAPGATAPGQPWGQEQQPPAGYGYGYGSAPGPYVGPQPPFAHWGYRVGSSIIDFLLYAVPATIGSAIANLSGTQTVNEFGQLETTDVPAWAVILSLLLLACSVAIFVWNTCIRQGRTGQSLGKQALGTKLVSARTGQPIGGGMAFARYLCHIVDALPCYLGYLWPIWDRERQTFADKIVSTYVIRV
jgi:uncharacterized RDD family membrane protein YckC